MKRIKLLLPALVVITILGFTQNCYSQKSLTEGYIINNQNDTVKGFVDYRNWAFNPDKILFKESLKDAQQEYTPSDIKEFGVAGEVYVSAIVDIETSPSKASELTFDSKLNLIQSKVFLQTLYKGKKNVYSHNSKSYNEQFYIPTDSSFQLLVYKKYLIKKKTQSVNYYTFENKQFANQLANYLSDCQSIRSNYAKMKYSKESIYKLFKEYYVCDNSNPDFVKVEDKPSLEYGVFVGGTYTKVEFIGTAFPHLVEGDMSTSNNFTLGTHIDIVFPRSQKRWSIANSIAFTNYTLNGQYETPDNIGWSSTVYSELGFGYLRLNSMLRHRFKFKNSSFYINGGFSAGKVLLFKNYRKDVIDKINSQEIKEGVAIDLPKFTETGWVAGAGFSFKNYFIESRYEKTNGISDYLFLATPTTRIYLILGYYF